ncbi:CDP-glycerol glycerophosphotransferase family protein [Staphylococcus durrellii]|uniref:CDP-glycerol glycerophosphotransferase family protein n=1 Tax=Staphylococcus durrellii TaxID=2781773 RepID=UPI001ABAAE4E
MNFKNNKVINQIKRKYKFVKEPLGSLKKSAYVKKITKYAKYYKTNKVNSNYVLYQSRDGQSMTDSPYAVFLHLLENATYKNLYHIWVVDTEDKKMKFGNEFRNYSNVKFIVKESDEYLNYLTESKYILNNSTFPAYFTKKADQIYINTWHGTPLKLMGLDVEDNLLGSQNIIKNFLSSDLLISPNKHTTEIFKRAFKLDGLLNGELFEIGYPRIDLTINSNKAQIIAKLKDNDVYLENEKVALFAPTWRGNDVHNAEDDIEEIYQLLQKMQNSTSYQILIKVHPFTYNNAIKHNELRPYLIPDTFDTNELLSIVDLLITDYSSIFFDFLVTNKPIVFYVPDYETYEDDRGFYIEPNQLPGPSISNEDDLITTINNIDQEVDKYKKQYELFKSTYTPYENGNVTKVLVDKIFSDKKYQTLKNKENILMFPGGMKNNGITTAAINLLQNIDYDKYDVTIFLNNTNDREILTNLKEVNDNVRILLRKGPLLATLSEKYRDTFVKNRGLNSFIEKLLYTDSSYKRESRKIFGNSQFDYVIDYSGYSMFWPKILLGTEAKRKIIYLHSDIKSDMQRTVSGRRPHYTNLKGAVSLYHRFDKLVSVSEVTKDINIKNIGFAADKNKFTSAMNLINFDKISNLVNDNSDYFQQNGKEVLGFIQNNTIKTAEFNDDNYNIMAMGRLSPEKGFDILIKAFADVVKEYPNAKLYILGDGPLKALLNNLINKLNLDDSVYLVGQKSNPFNIMKRCDLFVLTSHYEGQSMVLLEALTLNVNVLASDIPANRFVLKYGDYGMLAENTPENIGESILRFIKNEIPDYETFEAKEYNKQAINEFYDLFK